MHGSNSRASDRFDPQDFDRVLSSMCTRTHPEAAAMARRFMDDSPALPEVYETVVKLERRAVDLLGEVVGLDEPHGYVTTGGTEANIQAMRTARALGDTEAPNAVGSEALHFGFVKAADMLDVQLRLAPTDEDNRVDLTEVRRLADEDTVLVVGVAGTTEYGIVEPIPELGEIAASVDAQFHVDAAYGGFFLPATDHDWQFGHAPVDTMTIDPHKAGQAAIPAGGFLARDVEMLDALAVDTPYLERTSEATLTTTRSGAGPASTYAALEALWPDGYEAAYERERANAEWLADAFRERGYDVVDPELTIVAADVPNDVFERLSEKGWRILRTGEDELRVVCMPHVTREMLESFVADLDAVREETTGGAAA